MDEIEQVIKEMIESVEWSKRYNDQYCADIEDVEKWINELKRGLEKIDINYEPKRMD